LMFSEGLCIQEMRLRPLKKGTARIALEYSKDGSKLTVIPVGLNYMKPMEFREDLIINMDTPFNAADFAKEYNENNGKGIQSFNKRLVDSLLKSVIDIRDKKNEKAIAQLVEVEYNNGADLKKLISIVNLPYTEEDMSLLSDYRAELEKQNVRDEALAGKTSSVLMAIPATLIFGLAFWLYMIPVGGALNLVKKKIKSAEFKDSILIGAGSVFTLFYWIILFSVISVVTTVLWGLAAIVFLLLIASLAGPSYDVMRSVRNASIAKTKESMKTQREKVSKLSSSVLNLVESH
jgi:hypothetical protein